MDTKDNKNTQQIPDEELDKDSGRKLSDEDMNKVAGGAYDSTGNVYTAWMNSPTHAGNNL